MIKKVIFGLGFLVVLLFATHTVGAESKYNREHSEELFELIDWQEYKPATFELALKKQKPIFLMISAPAWCYWCHVYESRDYLYHSELYPYINENFITIFVDSDKRPDLTSKYLEGGWPSTTIFSPDFRRIVGFVGPRDPIELKDYLEKLVVYLKTKSFTEFEIKLNYEKISPKIPILSQLSQIEQNFLQQIKNSFDNKFGGFGQGNELQWRQNQKFPQTLALKYLLEQYDITKNKDYLEKVQITFNNQYTDLSQLETRYHLYDPVAGGWHRYSTNQDWSIPHYEKMLSDQAKLIQTYAHLLKITNNSQVKIAVEGSISFVIDKFYDKDGGFYASQDAYLEEEYFGLNKEQRAKIEPPYIDKTRNIDSNAMIIGAFLYLYQIEAKQEYWQIAKKSLDFLQNNMIGQTGAAYYFDYQKNESFLTGQTIANSWALLAFINGYNVLKQKEYLKTAEQIADYALNNLYDWDAGGFFERNSQEIEFYAPSERIDLSKPIQENGVFSYSLLRLYLATNKLEYLESGLKTLGFLINRKAGLDETYYIVKSAELVKDNGLLDVYLKNQEQINILVQERQTNFFLQELLEKERSNLSLDDAPKLKDGFSNIGFIILAGLALAAGLLSFLSPCCLPILSAYFAYNFNSNRGEMFKNTIFFFLGLATVFSILGMGATLIGNLFRENRIIFTQIAGAIIIIFGILEIFGKGFSGLHIKFKNNRRSPIGSYLFGLVFAIGWSACIGPILASLLLLSATTGTLIKGSALLFIYALGLAIPLIIISLYFDKIKNKRFWQILQGRMLNFKILKRQISIHSTYLISGIILIIIGVLIFKDYLYQLNQFALQTNYVQNFIIKAEEFLKNFFIR